MSLYNIILFLIDEQLLWIRIVCMLYYIEWVLVLMTELPHHCSSFIIAAVSWGFSAA